MNRQQEEIIKLIQQGEGVKVEFKQARQDLNNDVFETVCAFLNRHGGILLLGVKNSGRIQGIDPGFVQKIKNDFVTTINNPQKINPACYLSIEDIVVNDKILLKIYVSESSQVHRCNGRIYDRNEDGDFDITNHTRMVSELYQRKQTSYSENTVYPYAELSDLRGDLISWARNISSIQRKDHPWQ